MSRSALPPVPCSSKINIVFLIDRIYPTCLVELPLTFRSDRNAALSYSIYVCVLRKAGKNICFHQKINQRCNLRKDEIALELISGCIQRRCRDWSLMLESSVNQRNGSFVPSCAITASDTKSSANAAMKDTKSYVKHW